MQLIDSHCHLVAIPDGGDASEGGAFFSELDEVLGRAAAAGVSRLVCCGTSPEDWERVLQVSGRCSFVKPMVGIHPWFVTASWKKELQHLEHLLEANPQAGIGETGLDFQKRFANRAEQEAGFAAHLDLARDLNRPVAVHCVRAWGRLVEILRAHPAPRVQLHAFSGSAELVPELVALNCWFSFCGSVTNPKAKRVRAAVAAVPEDRILIETDAPDFPPPGCRSPNEPANLIQVAREVSKLRGVPVDVLASRVFENGVRFFEI